MPLSMLSAEQSAEIRKVGGSAEIKHHLENLGFVVGAKVTVVSNVNDNVIVNVKEARIAISREMAKKILV